MVTPRAPSAARGFTLIEAIMVIVITGIIASIVAVFIKTSVDSYLSTSRRAELTEAADVALRKLAREVRLAVPNSLRLTPAACPAPNAANTCTYLEFVPTKDGGRYRNEGDGSTAGNFLCTGGSTNATFDVLGVMPSIATGDFIVVYNDASLPNSGSPSNIYGGGSRAATTNNTSPLTLAAALGNSTLICSYANNRFQVVDKNIRAVTYACPTAVPNTMTRYWNYGFNAVQATPPGGIPPSARVVQNATCAMNYTPNVLQRNGLLSITLTVTDGTPSGEQIVAFREIHVDNAP
jgi:MSHA biogenesis protein MshO